MAAKIISVAMQKGGVGKTTSAHSIAGILKHKGYNVLLIDMDSQGNCTSWCDIKDEIESTVLDLMQGRCTINDCIYEGNIDILPSDDSLANLEMDRNTNSYLLKNAIDPLKQYYDFIIIDTPPFLGHLLVNSLIASDYVLIPCEARADAQNGLVKLISTIEQIQTINDLKILGVTLIKYREKANNLNKDAKADIMKYLNVKDIDMLQSIREAIAMPEARMVCKPIIEYNSKSNPCIDYVTLTDQILEKIK